MNFDVPIDEKQQRALFYYFVEAEIYPTTKPLVPLLDGGLFLLIFIICLVVEKCRNGGREWVCVMFFNFWDQGTTPFTHLSLLKLFLFGWVKFLVMKLFSGRPN